MTTDTSRAIWSPMTRIRTPTFCPLCRSRCGAIGVVEDDRLVALEVDPDHPAGEALCVKGKAAPEIVANPNRLLHPLIRTAPKHAADPKWRRASWDEALDLVAANLTRIARQSGADRDRLPRIALLDQHLVSLIAKDTGLPERLESLDADDLLGRFESDKKHTRDDFVLLLVSEAGQVVLRKIPRNAESRSRIKRCFKKVLDNTRVEKV